MALLTPAQFFYHYRDQQQDYARVYAARHIAPGDALKTVSGEPRAIAEGWDFSAFGQAGLGRREYIASLIFDERAEDAGDRPPALPKIAMSHTELQRYNAIARGDKVRIAAETAVDGGAPYDGFLVSCSGAMPIYRTNYEVSATFNNYAGRILSTQEERVVMLKGEPLLRGIVLNEDTTLQLRDGARTVSAGSILFRDDKADGGFTIEGPGFTRLGLRLATPVFEVTTALAAPLRVRRSPVSFPKKD